LFLTLNSLTQKKSFLHKNPLNQLFLTLNSRITPTVNLVQHALSLSSFETNICDKRFYELAFKVHTFFYGRETKFWNKSCKNFINMLTPFKY